MERLQELRQFFAELITAQVGVPHSRLTGAFAAIPREKFVGPGPWQIFTLGAGALQTPTNDPASLYQDVVIVLQKDRNINNGQPTLHAACLAALNVKEGETVVHVGAGTGYYTAVIAQLCGPSGRVVAYEIEPELAERASANLADTSNCRVYHRSGSEPPLEESDAIYVSAGSTAPMDVWLDALRPGGRLLFPLTPTQGAGGMLLITRAAGDRYNARFVCPAMFIPCSGARDEPTGQKLTEAFKKGFPREVRSLHRNSDPDETCWCSGRGWWLGSSPA